MKNHDLRPISSQAFPEANANALTNSGHNGGRKRYCGYCYHGGHRHSRQWNNRNGHHQKWNVYERHNKENSAERKNTKYDDEVICYRCGGKGH